MQPLNKKPTCWQGVVDKLALGPGGAAWLLTGSGRGDLTLWDMRFRLPVHAWRHPAGGEQNSTAGATAVLQHLQQCRLQRSRSI